MIVDVNGKNLFYVTKRKLTYRKVLVKVLVSLLQYFLRNSIGIGIAILLTSIVNSPAYLCSDHMCLTESTLVFFTFTH